ncbi:MAG: 50S ribosomal protein L11 methyltransferase [Verrucomicrobiota bacterium]
MNNDPIYLWSKLSSAKWQDAWEERFHAIEDTSIVINEFPDKKTIRVEAYCRHEEQAEKIKEQFGGSIRKIADRDWVAFSAPESPPVIVRDKFLVTPDTDEERLAKIREENAEREVLLIPAEMAFGTGDHATTATCLRMMCDLVAEGLLPNEFKMLDLGCGSGILAIAAMKLGASKALGTDYDEAAVRISQENLKRNGLTDSAIRFEQADVTTWSPEGGDKCDLICANIFADVLCQTLPNAIGWLAADGVMILSGILEDHLEDVVEASAANGLAIRERRQRGKWVTLLAGR